MGSDDAETGHKQDLHLNIGKLTAETRASIYRLLPNEVTRLMYSGPEYLGPLLPPIPETIMPPQFPIFEACQDWLFEHENFNRIPIKMRTHEFVRSREFDHDVILGNYSVSDIYCKEKFVTHIPWTPTDFADAYLHLCQFSAGKKLKQTDYSKKKDVCDAKPTNYFWKRYHGNLGYLDLRAAYWSILWPTTLDMQYDPITNEIVSEGRIPYIRCDEFAKWKLVRNILCTLFNYRDTVFWTPKGMVARRIPSATYRPYNYWYIMDVMNAIVADVKKHFTLLQWLTDAAIVPESEIDDLQEFLFKRWFLDSRIKYRGQGDSNSTNMYQIGNYQTAHYNPDIRGNYLSSIRPCKIEVIRMERMRRIRGEVPLGNYRKPVQRMQGRGHALSTAKHMDRITVSPKQYKQGMGKNAAPFSKNEMDNAIPMDED